MAYQSKKFVCLFDEHVPDMTKPRAHLGRLRRASESSTGHKHTHFLANVNPQKSFLICNRFSSGRLPMHKGGQWSKAVRFSQCRLTDGALRSYEHTWARPYAQGQSERQKPGRRRVAPLRKLLSSCAQEPRDAQRLLAPARLRRFSERAEGIGRADLFFNGQSVLCLITNSHQRFCC